MRLAVIPARGGSKRIPRKNIKLFAGLPMIVWSIRAAIQSQCFDKIIVSTDDLEIADIARSNGADVPFMRPAELSGDYVGTTPVIAHAIDWHNRHDRKINEACCIYATAPFILPEDIQKGLSVLMTSKVDYVFSVTDYPFPIQRAIRITNNHRVEMFHPDYFNVRSQDLELAWHDAGQFYWGGADSWLAGKPIFSNHAAPIVLPRYRVQDIDTLDDWKQAELLFSILNAS